MATQTQRIPLPSNVLPFTPRARRSGARGSKSGEVVELARPDLERLSADQLAEFFQLVVDVPAVHYILIRSALVAAIKG